MLQSEAAEIIPISDNFQSNESVIQIFITNSINEAQFNSEEDYKLINEGSYTVPTTVEKEIETNPFLRADNDNIKKNLTMNSASTEEIFAEIRKRKDNF